MKKAWWIAGLVAAVLIAGVAGALLLCGHRVWDASSTQAAGQVPAAAAPLPT